MKRRNSTVLAFLCMLLLQFSYAQKISFDVQNFNSSCTVANCDITTRMIVDQCILENETSTIPLQTMDSESYFLKESCFSGAYSFSPLDLTWIYNFYLSSGALSNPNNFLALGRWPQIQNSNYPDVDTTEGNFGGVFFEVENGLMNSDQLFYTVTAKVKRYPYASSNGNPTLKAMYLVDDNQIANDQFENGNNVLNDQLKGSFDPFLHGSIDVIQEEWHTVTLDLVYAPSALEEDIVGQQIGLFNGGVPLQSNLMAIDDIVFDCNQEAINYTLDLSQNDDDCTLIYQVTLGSYCPSLDYSTKTYTVQILDESNSVVTSFSASGQTFEFDLEGYSNGEYTVKIVDINGASPFGDVIEPELDFNHFIEFGNIQDLHAPEFTTTDQNGIPKQEFCYGEDIFIKIESVDYAYNAIYLDSWLDSQMENDWYSGTGWIFGLGEGVHNLSQLFRDANQIEFNPDDTYYIKLAVDHPRCGWVESSASFDFVCCEGNLATFNASITNTPSPYTITAESSRDFSEIGGTHNFCLYTDIDQDGEFEQVTCQSGPSFVYNGALSGITYYLVQWVDTPCGSFCYVLEFCEDCSNLVGGSNISTSATPCSSFDPPCALSTPTINCPIQIITNEGPSVRLEWPEIQGASGYQIVLTLNDPSCGCSSKGGEVISNIYTSTSNSIDIAIPGTIRPCFSYKVRARCPNAEYSEWSDPLCFPICTYGASERSEETVVIEEVDAKVYPNPFSTGIEIHKPESSILKIFNHLGQIVHTDNTKSSQLKINTADWKSGMYFLVLIEGGTIIFSEKIISIK